MESAIPLHLQTSRTQPMGIDDSHEPPYPSFSSRFAPSVTRVVMAYFGVQFLEDQADVGYRALQELAATFSTDAGPGHSDRARYVDEAGYTNVLRIAYWDDPTQFDTWFAGHGATWTSDAHANDGIGYFVELLRPSAERFETLFSAPDRPEGVGRLQASISDMIQEHAYWGGMRDRIPHSQTDPLEPSGAPEVVSVGNRLRVLPHHNLCLIRSGQDWGLTDSDERAMYLNDVEPILRAGMDFLRDDGLSIGCFANRFVTVINEDGSERDHTFGMSWWTSLAALEAWSKSHPTHVAIFGAAMKYLSTLGPAAQLKLYHEVTVAATDEQFFEYLNCHERTGMLRAASLAPSVG